MIIKVLLVEDNPDDIELLRILSSEMHPNHLDFTIAGTLSAGIDFASQKVYDIVLLDLFLPDSEGIETLIRFSSVIYKFPVIVMTGHNDENAAVEAVHRGAQDYLIKGSLDASLFWHSITYAIERKKMLAEMDFLHQKERQEKEINFLKEMSDVSSTETTARFLGIAPLKSYSPDDYKEILAEYEAILDRAVEKRIYKIKEPLSDDLRNLADSLGFLKAGPRDLIEIHTSVIEKEYKQIPRQKAQAYVEEGRIILLELMGYLVMFYRNYYAGGGELLPVKETGKKV